tara:strand:+ start:177236 stop:177763 length:528 start_codon:yes stop_codon:yes gene_type:complete
MGFFDFVADAGAKLTDTVMRADSGESATAPVEVSADRVDQLRAESITRSVAQLDIDGEQVQVSVAGDTATVTGSAPSQEALEKIVLCAGNQHGIARVDCQLTVDAVETAAPAQGAATGASESSFYTVQSGDTLGKIAKEQYGDAGKYPLIFEANKPMLTDPDKIYPGQSLRIPPL